jgi:hypothetical protein
MLSSSVGKLISTSGKEKYNIILSAFSEAITFTLEVAHAQSYFVNVRYLASMIEILG